MGSLSIGSLPLWASCCSARAKGTRNNRKARLLGDAWTRVVKSLLLAGTARRTQLKGIGGGRGVTLVLGLAGRCVELHDEAGTLQEGSAAASEAPRPVGRGRSLTGQSSPSYRRPCYRRPAVQELALAPELVEWRRRRDATSVTSWPRTPQGASRIAATCTNARVESLQLPDFCGASVTRPPARPEPLQHALGVPIVEAGQLIIEALYRRAGVSIRLPSVPRFQGFLVPAISFGLRNTVISLAAEHRYQDVEWKKIEGAVVPLDVIFVVDQEEQRLRGDCEGGVPLDDLQRLRVIILSQGRWSPAVFVEARLTNSHGS